jgi:hypothetical protein
MKSDKHNRPEEEAIIERFGQQARDVDVPPHLRQSNTAQIRGALEKMASGRDQRATWWRRRVSVPLPVAAAILLVVLVQLALQLTGAPGNRQSERVSTSDVPTGPSAAIERPQYAESCVYIARLGVVESNRTYFH